MSYFIGLTDLRGWFYFYYWILIYPNTSSSSIDKLDQKKVINWMEAHEKEQNSVFYLDASYSRFLDGQKRRHKFQSSLN